MTSVVIYHVHTNEGDWNMHKFHSHILHLYKYFTIWSPVMWNPASWIDHRQSTAGHYTYCQTSNTNHTLVSNKLVNHSDVVVASPVGAVPTTFSFSTLHLASIDWAKTTARLNKNHLSFWIWIRFYCISFVNSFYLKQLCPVSFLLLNEVIIMTTNIRPNLEWWNEFKIEMDKKLSVFLADDIQKEINSLWPRDPIWQHRSGSTWAPVVACCLLAPSHYLHHCWLITNEVFRHLPKDNFSGNTHDKNLYHKFESYIF